MSWYDDSRDDKEEVRDKYYRGEHKGYTYDGYGHYSSNTGCSGFTDFGEDEYGRSYYASDM